MPFAITRCVYQEDRTGRLECGICESTVSAIRSRTYTSQTLTLLAVRAIILCLEVRRVALTLSMSEIIK